MSFQEHISAIKRHFLTQKLDGFYKPRSKGKHILAFLFVGALNIIFGSISTIVYSGLFEISIPYTQDTDIKAYLPSGKIYLFLEMHDFYQTNLKYSKSISHDQLKGERPKNLKATEPLSYEGERVIYPAGILPNSFPQDSFEIIGTEVGTEDISWKSERDSIKPSGYTRDEVASPPAWPVYKEIPDLHLNERFVNWIYISPFPSFRKLWGTAYMDQEGDYTLKITSNFPYGKKYLTIAQSSVIGTKNYFISVGMFFIGLVMILASMLMYRSFLQSEPDDVIN
ncbi:Cdc50-like protein [Ordospora colligata]|nr:Cdc50-like protein [Ordospora colligata]